MTEVTLSAELQPTLQKTQGWGNHVSLWERKNRSWKWLGQPPPAQSTQSSLRDLNSFFHFPSAEALSSSRTPLRGWVLGKSPRAAALLRPALLDLFLHHAEVHGKAGHWQLHGECRALPYFRFHRQFAAVPAQNPFADREPQSHAFPLGLGGKKGVEDRG